MSADLRAEFLPDIVSEGYGRCVASSRIKIYFPLDGNNAASRLVTGYNYCLGGWGLRLFSLGNTPALLGLSTK